MWKIGNIEIKSKVVLAPMAGVTSLAYRKFMSEFGTGLTVSEMVSDCGLIYENKKTLDYIKTFDGERPVAIQLFGNDSSKICKAIDIVLANNSHIDMIDINLGCPVPKVTSTGAGSALLKDSEKLYKFMKEIVDYSPIPVTAKIRLGWNENSINFRENIRMLEKAGVAAIGIHSRTTSQGYTGKARHELLKDLRDEMSVPLVVSGDIYSLDDVINVLNLTKADAVMVARGGVGNPTLVKQINAYYEKGIKVPNASLIENLSYLEKFTDLLIEEKGEYRAISILRGIAPKFLDGYPGMKQYKNMIAQSITDRESLMRIIQNLK